jgi:hypothetical protein
VLDDYTQIYGKVKTESLLNEKGEQEKVKLSL